LPSCPPLRQPGQKWSELDDLTRSELEQDCEFLGLIIMQVRHIAIISCHLRPIQNLLKKETFGAIAELHQADVVTLMVTGDNIQTAISIGRDCELVKTDQTIIRVEAEDTAGLGQLTVTYRW
jgi:magnesium-transporting ATPase (P-type)